MARKTKMLSKVRFNYQKKDASKKSTLELDIDLSRFETQYEKAQYALDSAVMTSMVPYMPHQTGTFINVTKGMSAALAGSGTVIAAAPPMGRFLYEGKVMVDEETGSPWARAGAKKVVTDRDFEYSKAHNPDVTAHWFDTAKQRHGASWVAMVKKIAGGDK